MENVPARIVAVSNGARRTLAPGLERKAVTVYNGMTAALSFAHDARPIP